jgi:hypothetical protein
MWMFDTLDIPFSWLNNTTYNIKAVKDIPAYNRCIDYKITSGQLIDEIATKSEIYGEGRESDSYKIFEANACVLVENKFDLTKIKTLKIPV